jgi:hypothetical protein
LTSGNKTGVGSAEHEEDDDEEEFSTVEKQLFEIKSVDGRNNFFNGLDTTKVFEKLRVFREIDTIL